MSPECELKLKKMLERHEGYRRFVYPDTKGIPTVAIGRNLRDKGISPEEAYVLLDNDINEIVQYFLATAPWFSYLDEVRQAVLIDMAMMGPSKVFGFKKMIAAIMNEDWVKAAHELLDSDYAKPPPVGVGARAVELADMMRTGVWQ